MEFTKKGKTHAFLCKERVGWFPFFYFSETNLTLGEKSILETQQSHSLVQGQY